MHPKSLLRDWSLEARELRSSWRKDLLASVVVFLVALPLCMGIAIASGAPPAAGLITGIIGGLVVGFIAGAPLQVSGPAAGLSVIVWDLIQTHGFEALGWIIVVAGVIQICAGLTGIGQWFRAVSPAVIHGMLAGIGVLILASQFHVMVDDAPRGSGLANLVAIPEAVWKGFVPADGSVHNQAAMTGLLTLFVMVGWRPLAPQRLRVIPAPLAAVVVATLVAWGLSLDVSRVNIPASLLDAVAVPGVSALGELGWGVLGAGLALAFVASAETLLCATAVDKLHSGPRTAYDRELTAQGVGNLLCGLVGGLPMTGVIVRSSANVEAGARTRASAILHGGWLLLFCVGVPFILSQIPTAVLAAVLVFTGYKLVNVAAIRKLAEYGRSEVLIYAVTLAGIIIFDLLTGVIAGIALSLAKLLYNVSHLSVELREGSKEGQLEIHLVGAATVMRLPRLAAALEQVPPNAELHVHMDDLDYIDHACIDLLMNWETQHEATGGRLFIDWHNLQALFRKRKVNDPGLPRVA
jgi:MFS superfamily sulfate permease-like transporter